MSEIQIGNRKIGDGFPAYIIAEMSANHAGSIEHAKEIIRAAKECGADCVKIQTYTPDTLTIDCSNGYFNLENGLWKGENLYSLYGKAYTPWEWHRELKEEAEKTGIDFFSTPFDTTSVDFLEELGARFYKIASFEMIDLPLLKYVASKGKPMILSTGMGTWEEIREAVEAVRGEGNDSLALMKCSSAYPARYEEMNLATIADMKRRLGVPVGLSDHSMGHLSAVTAVALGANIIEKHFCISRENDNPDADFSMNKEEFRTMVKTIRDVEASLGSVMYGVSQQEKESIRFRRSVFVIKDIKAGECFQEENIRIIRPGFGEKPKYMEDILGMRAEKEIKRGTPFSFSDVKKGSILFLTNNENTKELLEWLQTVVKDTEVYRFANKLDLPLIQKLQPELLISYNYRHIIPEAVIEYMHGQAVNLHTSMLPHNGGVNPNFFSFMENTPKGVTIHRLAKGIDAGDILFQEEVPMEEAAETFASSYDKLQQCMCELFKDNWEKIRDGSAVPRMQDGAGSYHSIRQMEEFREKYPFSWDENIAEMKRRYGL